MRKSQRYPKEPAAERPLSGSGKKHWLTIEFDDVADQPQGYAYARLDKKNYRRIMAALEAATGLEIEESIEE